MVQISFTSIASRASFLIASLIVVGSTLDARAQGRGGYEPRSSGSLPGRDSGGNRLITVGAGVSQPSGMAALYENPAGLSATDGFRMAAYGAALAKNLRPTGVGLQAYTGNRSVGITGGVLTYVNSPESGSLKTIIAPIGLSAGIEKLKVGGVCHLVLARGGDLVTTEINAGAQYDLQPLTFGLSVQGLTSGLKGVAGGASLDLGNDASISLDAGTDGKFQAFKVKPGLGVNVETIQLALGWGLHVNKVSEAPAIRSGLSIGVGLGFGDLIHVQYYFNQIAEQMALVSIKI